MSPIAVHRDVSSDPSTRARTRFSPCSMTSLGSFSHKLRLKSSSESGPRVTDRAEIGNHARQIGDPVADHHAVFILLDVRIGRGRQVVDVKAGETVSGQGEKVVDRSAPADHVEDVGDHRGPRVSGFRSDRPGGGDVVDAVDETEEFHRRNDAERSPISSSSANRSLARLRSTTSWGGLATI